MSIRWQDIYNYIPGSLKHAAKWSYGRLPLRLRWGKEFFRQLKFLEGSQWWSPQELENYQNEKLRPLIKHAYKNTPYYNRLFKENNLSPSDIKTIHDLPKIPILTKEIVRQSFQQMVATNIDRKNLVRFSTSGTTGKPLIFYSEKRLEFFNFGPYMWRYYRWAGQRFHDVKVLLSSWTLKPKRDETRKIIEYNVARHQLIFSSYDVNRKNAPLFARALQQYRPKFIEAFPASLEALIGFFKELDIKKPIQLKAIFTNSEVLYPWQRKLFIDYFDCPVFDVYSLEERVVIGAECEQHTDLHIFSEYGIAEFVDDSRKIISDYKSGQIVATNLNNYGMPFIRYNTQDMAHALREQCLCGRGLPLLRLVGGRTRNFVVSKSGSIISVTIVDIPNASDNVHQFQFIQIEKGKLALKIVKKDNFSEVDLKKIHNKLNEKFSNDMEVDIDFVDAITQNPSGKKPLLIQKVKI